MDGVSGTCFIFLFALAAGEGVRLKLQTPLFVADALIGAAGRHLATELSTAQVRALPHPTGC